MRSFREDDSNIIVGINITPFVDITLVLLVIFIVINPLINKKGIQLVLPKASTSLKLQNETNWEIDISKQGDYFLNNEKINLIKLSELGVENIKNNKELIVVIRADKEVFYSIVVKLMDVLRNVGITKIFLETSQKSVKMPKSE